MPTRPQPELRKAHPAIQRFFEASLYLLLFVSFGMLAGTGKLDILTVLIGGAALLARGYLLLRGIEVSVSEEWTSYLTLGYVAFFALDYFVISQSFIGALVHMVLFAALLKVFSIHRERDYIYLAILSFGMVLAAAVLTVDTSFFVSFCSFALLAIATFVSLEMRRSWIAGHDSVAVSDESVETGKLPAAISRVSLVLVVALVLATAVLFFVIPRKNSAGYLSAFGQRSEISTGFNEEVQLGQIGQIEQSNNVAMHVKFAPGSLIPREMLWRGISLTNFDGRRWTGPHEEGDLQLMNSRSPAPVRTSRLFLGNGARVNYQVSLEPFGSRVFFVLPEAISLHGRYQVVRIDSTSSIFNQDASRAVNDYDVVSQLPPPMMPAKEARLEPSISQNIYLQLPEKLDPRIQQLAERVSAAADSPFLKASAIERYLSRSYGYTLQLPSSTPADPIANFLFERRKGHCEYFASSMVLMLRSLGIPSRLINGFRGGEFNSVNDTYIVRARDAHSWVEAYFPGYGWYTFDPTPAATFPQDRWARLYLYADAMREFWHDWIVNYDSGHQVTLAFSALREAHSGYEDARKWSEAVFARSLRVATRVRVSFEQNAAVWIKWTTWLLSSVVVLLLVPQILEGIRRIRVLRRPGSAPKSAASLWYEQLLRWLSKRGLPKAPAQTPQEFVRSISDYELRRRVGEFTTHYERARFGGSTEDAERLPELYRDLVAKD